MNNILVCDDDKDIVKIISVYLTNEGYNVKTAYNGREALDILEREENSFVDFGYYDAGDRRDTDSD